MISLSARRLLWPAALVALGVALTAAAVLFSHSGSTSPSATPTAETPNVSGEGVVCFGTVDLEHGVASLYPLQAGRVARVCVHEDEHVRAGTVLLQLEDDLARSRLAEAEAAVQVAEVQLEQARKLPEQHSRRIAQQETARESMRHRLEAARLMLADKQDLARKDLARKLEVSVSEEQVRELEALERGETQRLADLKAQAQDVQTDVRRAEKEVAAARARREQARLALEEYSLKAPQDGTVLRLLVGPGDVLGAQPAQAAVLFAADGPQVVRAEVEQEYARRVHKGDRVKVEDEVETGMSWDGHVERVAGWYHQRRTVLNDPSQMHDVRTLECLVILDSNQPPLRLGQRVRVLIGRVPQ
jgi:multidrug resistance efflux pump